MPLTYAIREHLALGNVKGQIVDITFDASYDAGGETVSKEALGFAVIYGVFPIAANAAAGGYTFAYNPTTRRLLAFWGDYSATVDGPHVEVPAATNLSGVTVRCLVLGAG